MHSPLTQEGQPHGCKGQWAHKGEGDPSVPHHWGLTSPAFNRKETCYRTKEQARVGLPIMLLSLLSQAPSQLWKSIPHPSSVCGRLSITLLLSVVWDLLSSRDGFSSVVALAAGHTRSQPQGHCVKDILQRMAEIQWFPSPTHE